MDTRKIFIVNLSKGLIGEENMRLLGGMIITKLQMTVMERVDMPENQRQDFYLYVDEFQNFANESFASILSEARKYRLNLIVAHQYIEQMDEVTRSAVFGNVGTLLMFRVGAADAEILEQEFAPVFTAEDLVNLRKFDVYLKLMINGAASEPFSASTLPPIGNPTGSTEKVVNVSRERYSRPRSTIEGKILRWSGLAPDEDPENDAENDIVSAASELGISSDDLKGLEKLSPKVKEAEPPASKKKKEAKYEIPCSVCGEVQKLTFEPDWSKPWYCKQHLEMRGKIPMRELKFYDQKKQAELAKMHQGGSDAPVVIDAVVVDVSSDKKELPEEKAGRQEGRKAGRNFAKKGDDKRERPKNKPQKPKRDNHKDRKDKKDKPKKFAPPPIRESAPVLMNEDVGGLSLSKLESREDVTKESERKKKKAERKGERSEDKKPEPPPASDDIQDEQPPTPESTNDTAQSDDDDQGPKQIKPGQVVKF